MKVKEAYDRSGYKRTLEVAIKSTLKGNLNILCYYGDIIYESDTNVEYYYTPSRTLFVTLSHSPSLSLCLSPSLNLSLSLSHTHSHSHTRSPHLTGHYQLACLTLISGDMSQSPCGSDKEPYDDEQEVDREGTYILLYRISYLMLCFIVFCFILYN